MAKSRKETKSTKKDILDDMFEGFKKNCPESKFKHISRKSTLREIEKIDPFSGKEEEFERSINKASQKHVYRSQKLNEIEKKYDVLEQTVLDLPDNINNLNINKDWSLGSAVFNSLYYLSKAKRNKPSQSPRLERFIPIIEKAHRNRMSMWYTDEIEKCLEEIISAIHDYRMYEYLDSVQTSRKAAEDYRITAKGYEIIKGDKVAQFIEIEETLKGRSYLTSELKWEKTKNELIALIHALVEGEFFKEQRPSISSKKKEKGDYFIDLNVTDYFQSRYKQKDGKPLSLKEQRQKSYRKDYEDKLNTLINEYKKCFKI